MGEGPTIHVVGAGLAGLAASLHLIDAGRLVVIHESTRSAGGRCRSYFDKTLGHRIDNGNHLLLSGNKAAFAYIDRIGAGASITGPSQPIFPFIDRSTGETWSLRLSPGRVPWWMLRADRRVPGTRFGEYLHLLKLRRAGPESTVAETLQPGPLFRRLIEPLAIASLNTAPDESSAALFAAIIDQTLMRGGRFCIPRFPREGLSESLIDPAIATLKAAGATFCFGHRISGLRVEEGRISSLLAADGPVNMGPDDAVVLAVPAPIAAELLPGLTVPDAFRAIVNVHFRFNADPGSAGFFGVIGGVAEWVFIKPGIVSITISAAEAWVERPAEAIAEAVWPDVVAALGLGAETSMPDWRVIKEKRATFAATPAQERRRPTCHTAFNNLVIAGDWTATGLPATIEGAIRSGSSAAAALLEREHNA
jgi:squalene-associated FAD-dependent desaturase